MSLAPDAVNQLSRYSDGLHGRGFNPRQAKSIFLFCTAFRPALGPRGGGGSFSGSKAAAAVNHPQEHLYLDAVKELSLGHFLGLNGALKVARLETRAACKVVARVPVPATV
jgi:hypothetical protein